MRTVLAYHWIQPEDTADICIYHENLQDSLTKRGIEYEILGDYFNEVFVRTKKFEKKAKSKKLCYS